MADVTTMRTAAESALAEAFAARKTTLPGDAASREEAFRRFAETGLPHRRVEEWKYTDLRAAMREAAPLAAAPSAATRAAVLATPGAFDAHAATTIAIVDGHLAAPIAGLPAGVEAISMAEALAAGHPLLASLGTVETAADNAAYTLNAAFVTDGIVLRVAAGALVEAPINLRFVVTGTVPVATATRVLVVVEEGASLTLVESHETAEGVAHQTNGVAEFVVADRARVRHIRLDRSGDGALALSTLTARLGGEVSFDTLNVVTGAGLTRHQVFLTFAGEHSRAGIRGATMLKGRQHADTTLVVDHAAAHCESRELFKTAVDGEAVGVFQGKIIVRPGAQKTDGRMMSAAVLLAEGATMNNKPELEIFADDVQCAHGATCGQLDEDLLFYLMARGIPRPQAEALMVESFLGEAVEEAIGEDDGLRDTVMGAVEAWLAARA